MLLTNLLPWVATLLALTEARPQGKPHGPQILKRQLPAQPKNVTTIISPSGANITYKMPGKEGVCETTKGVNSYSGYINIAPDTHMFFYFFESRRDPANDPMTLWLNGGPGSDSLIGLFTENGPCKVGADLTTSLNPYSWSNISNMLYLSQPVGVGFSYSTQEAGSIDQNDASLDNSTVAPPDGRYPVANAWDVDTSDLAAIAAWEVLQAFYSALPQLDSKVHSTQFNLFTESYGGHYGPAFFDYFYTQNEMIANGTKKGKAMTFNALGIINGIIDEMIQAPSYLTMVKNNSYGIPLVNDTVYDYMKFALNMPGGCLEQIGWCAATNLTSQEDMAICAEAEAMCRDNVEGPYELSQTRGVYDIRVPYGDDIDFTFQEYLNLAHVQDALGVDLNYSSNGAATDIYYAFQTTGEFIWPNFIDDLEHILKQDVRVSLAYGDADYICNWYGGEAISLAADYPEAKQFRAAGYAPMMVNGKEYGEVREYGNFSFARIYEAGHTIPTYQPIAALQWINRTINHWDIATGMQKVTANLGTKGKPKATHTESSVPLPTATST